VSGFGVAARRAREGGLDGVEVSMAHGYLAAQFFAPASNRRGDEDAVAPLASKTRWSPSRGAGVVPDVAHHVECPGPDALGQPRHHRFHDPF
jgi:hypothetical protein